MLRLFNNFYGRWYFPLLLQIITLLAFIFLIVIGLGADTKGTAFTQQLRNTNLANLLVWSVWWPLIIITAVVLGRMWCMICPMELVTSLASKIGLKRKPPKWLRSGWVITLAFIVILFVGMQMLSIHRVPVRMAIYLLMLFGVGIIVGLLFARNAFCASVCPVGHLLGLYARISPLSWGVRDAAVCKNCSDRSCVASRTAYNFQGRSCGVSLMPAKIQNNDECLLCGQCRKACANYNPGLETRPNPELKTRPWLDDLLHLRPLSSAQIAFCLVISGFVIYEVLTEWQASKQILFYVPYQLGQWLNLQSDWSQSLLKSISLFVILPLVIWLGPYGMLRTLGREDGISLRSYLGYCALILLPIMAAMHILKSLIKMATRIPYWNTAIQDPFGLSTAQAILDRSLQLPALPFWYDVLLSLISFALIFGSFAASIFITRKVIASYPSINRFQSVALYFLPILYCSIYVVMLIGWRF